MSAPSKRQVHRYIWCPQDEHGDHEINLTYTIRPGCAPILYGPQPQPGEDPEVEILSAEEGGHPRELSRHEEQIAETAIYESHDWDDGQPDEATEWRDYDRDC